VQLDSTSCEDGGLPVYETEAYAVVFESSAPEESADHEPPPFCVIAPWSELFTKSSADVMVDPCPEGVRTQCPPLEQGRLSDPWPFQVIVVLAALAAAIVMATTVKAASATPRAPLFISLHLP
jgi:hypothetical protein